jgi:hypothetical protein
VSLALEDLSDGAERHVLRTQLDNAPDDDLLLCDVLEPSVPTHRVPVGAIPSYVVAGSSTALPSSLHPSANQSSFELRSGTHHLTAERPHRVARVVLRDLAEDGFVNVSSRSPHPA